MIILYLILLDPEKFDSAALIRDVEKSLEILRTMDSVHVARRCFQLISEVLEIAKAQVAQRRTEPQPQAPGALDQPLLNDVMPDLNNGKEQQNYLQDPVIDYMGELQDNPALTNLIDFSLLEGFTGFGNTSDFGRGIGLGGERNQGQMHMGGDQYTLRGEDGVLFDVQSETKSGFFEPLLWTAS